MKNVLNVSLACALLASAPAAFAKGKGGPCRAIREACSSAGFVKGGAKEGKGLWKNCINEIVEGKTVQGVDSSKFNNGDVESCKAKLVAKKADVKK